MIGATLLYRHIHPNFMQNGFASSRAFRPNDDDAGLMSVYDGDLMNAEDSWTHFTTVSKRRSAGAMSISVDECVQEGLATRPDPTSFPEHAVVDFTQLNEKECRTVSKKLQSKAQVRGWCYQPPAA